MNTLVGLIVLIYLATLGYLIYENKSKLIKQTNSQQNTTSMSNNPSSEDLIKMFGKPFLTYEQCMEIVNNTIYQVYSHYYLGEKLVEGQKVIGNYAAEMKKITVDVLFALTPIFYANLEFYVTKEYIEQYIGEQVQLMTLEAVQQKQANAIPYNKARESNIPVIRV